MYSSRKLNSVEGGTFTTTRKLFHIDIDSGIVDMSQSYLVLPTQISSANAGVHNVSLKKPANSMIRNAKISSSRKDIEVNQYVNVFNAALDAYKIADSNSRAWMDGTIEKSDDKNDFSCFRNLRQDVASTERRADLRVSMRDLFYGVGAFQRLPVNALGKLRIQIELESSVDLLQSNRRYTAATDADGFKVKGTADSKKLITDADFISRGDVGFWVGETIKINAQAAALTITAISVPDANKKITITVNQDPAPVIADGADAHIFNTEAGALSFDVLEPSLIVMEYKPSDKESQKISRQVKRGFEFQCWSLEQDNLKAGNSYFKQFYLDPGCDRTLLLATDGASLTSSINNFTDYRTEINNVDTTNKNVEYNTSLYRDRIMRAMPIQVQNLTNTTFVIPERVPLSKNQLAYQVNLQGAAMPASNVYLFKRVIKVL